MHREYTFTCLLALMSAHLYVCTGPFSCSPLFESVNVATTARTAFYPSWNQDILCQ